MEEALKQELQKAGIEVSDERLAETSMQFGVHTTDGRMSGEDIIKAGKLFSGTLKHYGFTKAHVQYVVKKVGSHFLVWATN
jgi:hypothetical protein